MITCYCNWFVNVLCLILIADLQASLLIYFTSIWIPLKCILSLILLIKLISITAYAITFKWSKTYWWECGGSNRHGTSGKRKCAIGFGVSSVGCWEWRYHVVSDTDTHIDHGV